MSEQQPPGPAQRARRACEKCTRTKKKCDKALPICTRCTRLSTNCCYNFVYTPPSLSTPDAQYVRMLAGRDTAISSYASSSSPATPYSLFNILALPELDVTPAQVISLLNVRRINWRDVCDQFFLAIFPWAGIVHPETFRAKISSVSKGDNPPNVELALLVVCMHMVLRPADDAAQEPQSAGQAKPTTPMTPSQPPPPHTPHTPIDLTATTNVSNTTATTSSLPGDIGSVGTAGDMLASPIYRAIKRLLALVRALSAPTIEMVQCNALVALYEHGHGDPWQAYLSLAEAVAISRLLNVSPGRFVEGEQDLPTTPEEEERCVLYWSLFILDNAVPRGFHRLWPKPPTTPLHTTTAQPTSDPLSNAKATKTTTTATTTAAAATATTPSAMVDSQYRLLHFDCAYLTVPLQMAVPPDDALLPTQNRIWDDKTQSRLIIVRRMPLAAYAGVGARVGAFQHTCQAAVLLHRAALWEERARSAPRPSAESFAELELSARRLIEVLVMDSTLYADSNENFEGLAMSLSLLLMLHATVLGSSAPSPDTSGSANIFAGLGAGRMLDDEASKAVAGINFAVRMTCDSVKDFVERYTRGAHLIKPFSPQAAYTAYHVLRALLTLEHIVDDGESMFHDAYSAMYAFAKRWGVAGKLLAIIEAMLEEGDDDDVAMTGGGDGVTVQPHQTFGSPTSSAFY